MNTGEAEEVEKWTIPQDITEGWPGLSGRLEEGKEGGRAGSVILRVPGPGDQLAGGTLAGRLRGEQVWGKMQRSALDIPERWSD